MIRPALVMSEVGWGVSAFRSGLLGLAVGAGLMAPYAFAQAVSGTILGDVRDATGAVVPGATVSLVHTGTGFTRTLATDAKGEYTAPSLPTGTYSVSAELDGLPEASPSRTCGSAWTRRCGSTSSSASARSWRSSTSRAAPRSSRPRPPT